MNKKQHSINVIMATLNVDICIDQNRFAIRYTHTSNTADVCV